MVNDKDSQREGALPPVNGAGRTCRHMGASAQRLMTIQEVSDLLGIHVRTVRRWEKSGELPSERYGKKGSIVRFDPAVVAAFRKGKRSGGGTGSADTGDIADEIID